MIASYALRPIRLPAVSKLPGAVTFLALNLAGLVAYLHPFVFAGARERDARWFEHSGDAPLIFGAIGFLCVLLVIAELTDGRLNSKALAALAVLSAMAAVLRTVTLPAGANLFWLLVILGGYRFGPRHGFLLGAFAMLLSAVVTAGFGPWLPFQVFGASWVGMGAGLFGRLRPRGMPLRADVAFVAAYGALAAIFYGFVVNLWSWPFWVGGPDISYDPSAPPWEALRRYLNYYILTSFGWDLAGSVCNVVAITFVGGPLLAALERFRRRFSFELG